jgi:TatD DNase family protein
VIDSHIHLDFSAFSADLDELLSLARRVGISSWVVPGYSLEPTPDREAVLGRQDVHVAVGIHPYASSSVRDLPSAVQRLRNLASDQQAVAIGECGLDRKKSGLSFEGQEQLFGAQLRLARELDLPVIVHQVGARQEFQGCLARVGVPPRGGVVHSFAGDSAWAKFLIKQGFFLGVGPTILREDARRLRATVAEIPIERLLVETDAPDQRPSGQSRGVPTDLALVVEALAALRQTDPGELGKQTAENARRLFSLGRR